MFADLCRDIIHQFKEEMRWRKSPICQIQLQTQLHCSPICWHTLQNWERIRNNLEFDLPRICTWILLTTSVQWGWRKSMTWNIPQDYEVTPTQSCSLPYHLTVHGSDNSSSQTRWFHELMAQRCMRTTACKKSAWRVAWKVSFFLLQKYTWFMDG